MTGLLETPKIEYRIHAENAEKTQCENACRHFVDKERTFNDCVDECIEHLRAGANLPSGV